MDAIIVSDIHLGAYNCQAKAFCSFIESVYYELQPEYFILNGDVFDSFDSRLRKWHWKALTELRKIADEVRIIWVQGNHDRDGPADMVAHLFGAAYHQKYFIFPSGDRQILCIHGDKWDKFTSERPVMTWIADQFYWLLQKLDPSFFLARLAKKSSKTFLRNTQIVEAGARKMMAKKECDIVCCGHTHHAVAGDCYFNSGSWTETPPTYLVVNQGRVELRSFVL